MEQTKYDVFISYSRKDYVDEHKNVIPGNEVSKIKDALTNAGISYWFDEKGIVSGEDYAAKIVKHIKASKIIIYISSEAANKSDWTRKEIACALMYKKYVIPVLLDESPFHDSVMLRIVDLDRIDYYLNPQQGLDKLIRSINTYLEDQQAIIARKVADDKRRQEELESQHRLKEEEQKRQKRIDEIETEIAALESQKVENKKAILQKEQELKLAQVDLEECESKIQKLQQKLQELQEPKTNIYLKEEVHSKDRVFSYNGVSFKMIRVEGGGMGTFYIGETQVTQELWQAVMGNNPSYFKGQNHPMACVSWNDICGKDGTGTDPDCFLYKLNEGTGKEFRLPKESEWEYAAKGGNKSKNYTYAGSDNIDEVAWYWKNSGDKYLEGSDDDWDWDTIEKNNDKTHPVKQLAPNEIGVYDMSGNVWEWCQDLYDPKGSKRVLRGGSWLNHPKFCYVDSRYDDSPDNNNINCGFRLALAKP